MKIVILAGGSGTRLWPLSRSTYPKQFLRLGGSHSLLQKTVLRFLKHHKTNDLMVITSGNYYEFVRSQLLEIDSELIPRIALEPCKKNTMPAIAWTFKLLEEKSNLEPKEPVLICPSDHLIDPEDAFLEQVRAAENVAIQGNIVTFGVHPTRPETGYGYIKVSNSQSLASIEAFIEKPDFKTAQEYLLQGGFLWNAGIFMLTLECFWQEAAKFHNEIGKFARSTLQDLEEAFASFPELSFDYAIMEKTDRAVVMPLHMTWSDVGSWDSLYDVLEKNEEGNVAIGNVSTLDTCQSLIMGQKRLIATIGLSEMLVIDTADALFIAKRGESQKVKALVDALKANGAKEVTEHVEVQRPWGSYTVLEEGPNYKIKKIHVAPSKKLTLQMHNHRSEHWVVLRGTARVIIDRQELIIQENESAFVPKGSAHQLENFGENALEIIEIQVGSYVAEDDMVCLESAYALLKKEEP